jgi:hypothetical protein
MYEVQFSYEKRGFGIALMYEGLLMDPVFHAKTINSESRVGETQTISHATDMK